MSVCVVRNALICHQNIGLCKTGCNSTDSKGTAPGVTSSMDTETQQVFEERDAGNREAVKSPFSAHILKESTRRWRYPNIFCS